MMERFPRDRPVRETRTPGNREKVGGTVHHLRLQAEGRRSAVVAFRFGEPYISQTLPQQRAVIITGRNLAEIDDILESPEEPCSLQRATH